MLSICLGEKKGKQNKSTPQQNFRNLYDYLGKGAYLSFLLPHWLNAENKLVLHCVPHAVFQSVLLYSPRFDHLDLMPIPVT